MTPAIELPREALLRRRSAKWCDYPADVLPAWIAEMDFGLPPPVRDALMEIAERQDGGYPRRDGGQPTVALARAFAARMQDRFAWMPDPRQVQALADLTQGVFAALTAFTVPGDGVLVHTPCYPSLRAPVTDLGRRFAASRLLDDGTGWRLDFAGMEAEAAQGLRMILLCNPHNPTGRVFTHEELLRLAEFARRHDLLVVSDEVHSDFVFVGHRHIPFASLSEDAAGRTITLTSGTKSFNMAGLRCGVMHFGTAGLAEAFWRKVPSKLLGQPGIAGVDATIAAWRDGQPWLDAVMAELASARAVLATQVAALPGLRMHAPEATYFAWIDASGCGFADAADFFLRQGRLAFSPGQSFSPECAGFARVNFATSAPLREEIVQRMRQALARQESPT